MMLNLDRQPQSQPELEPEPRYQIPVPFLGHQTGLGDAVHAAIQRVAGTRQNCKPCEARQVYLNSQVRFNPWIW